MVVAIGKVENTGFTVEINTKNVLEPYLISNPIYVSELEQPLSHQGPHLSFAPGEVQRPNGAGLTVCYVQLFAIGC